MTKAVERRDGEMMRRGRRDRTRELRTDEHLLDAFRAGLVNIASLVGRRM